ncbi:MAG: CvpA family protein [Bacteroidaceae bacterium]|nr:CvpA family protein [Bacteroidaceae bacterium]MBQ3957785.1 CvpA family protein [Bacteroidaceae bacterium]
MLLDVQMLPLDWILLGLLLFGAVKGFIRGAVRQLLSLGGIFLGLLLAKMFYEVLGAAIAPHLNHQTSLANTLAFVGIWILVPAVLGLIGEVVSTVLDKIFVLGTVNKLLGAVLGFFKYEVLLGALIWVFASTGFLSADIMRQSVMCEPLKAVPEAIYKVLIDDEGRAGEE